MPDPTAEEEIARLLREIEKNYPLLYPFIKELVDMFRRWAAGPIDPELRRRLLALLAAIAHWARQMAGRLPPEVERLLG